MSVKLLTEHRLEFLSLKGVCTGLSECTLVKMPHCWKSHVMNHFVLTAISGTLVTRCFSEPMPTTTISSPTPPSSPGSPVTGSVNNTGNPLDRGNYYLLLK